MLILSWKPGESVRIGRTLIRFERRFGSESVLIRVTPEAGPTSDLILGCDESASIGPGVTIVNTHRPSGGKRKSVSRVGIDAPPDVQILRSPPVGHPDLARLPA